jgi:hypothetical protein
VIAGDVFGTRKVGDRSSHAKDTIVRASGQLKLAHSTRKQ